MARVFTQKEAKHLGLPGRKSLEIVSGEKGAGTVTLRLVEIPALEPGETLRSPHSHCDVEECIFVLSGKGTTYADSGEYPLQEGDTIVLPAGEKHVTRNTGNRPLRLLCFFPAADIATRTQEHTPASKDLPKR